MSPAPSYEQSPKFEDSSMPCRQLHSPDRDFERLLIFGAGGHAREVAWLAEQCWGEDIEIVHLVDQSEFLVAGANGRQVQLLQECKALAGDRYLAAVGDSALRERAVSHCDATGMLATTLVHPRTEASKWLMLGSGSIICAGSVLTTNINIGRHVHINVGCTISHDVSIGNFTTVSPGVHISGNVQIGRHVFVGTGVNIINGAPGTPLIIGDGALIAAGACVTKSVQAGTMMAGVPATRKR